MSQVMVETRTGISIRHCSQWMGQVKPHWEVKQDKELHGKKRCFIVTMGLYCPATREKQSCFLCRKTDTETTLLGALSQHQKGEYPKSLCFAFSLSLFLDFK